jgi:hypothetical protein
MKNPLMDRGITKVHILTLGASSKFASVDVCREAACYAWSKPGEIRDLRRMSDPSELYEIAADILVRTGAIAACREHPDVMVDQGDNEALDHAFAIGVNRARKGSVRGTIDAMIEAIESAHRDAAWNCRECERNKRQYR